MVITVNLYKMDKLLFKKRPDLLLGDKYTYESFRFLTLSLKMNYSLFAKERNSLLLI